MDLIVTAFSLNGTIPRAFTADGEDRSPALSWEHPPAGTQCFALIMDDPDAPSGLWTHWTLYDLPAPVTALAENTPKAPTLANGAKQGRNTWGRTGYNGPSPPPGKPHRYVFRLYALSHFLDLPAGATREALDSAMKGSVLAVAEFTGVYQR